MATDPELPVSRTETGAGYELRPARLDTDAAAIAALFVEYMTWALGRFQEEYDSNELPTDIDQVGNSLGSYVPPAGLMIVAEQGDELIGVAALRTLGTDVVEVKRMYVVPQWRAHRLGSALLDRLLLEARETFQAKTVRLDTCRFMTQAQRLYQDRGFVERSPYEGTEIPEAFQKYWRFFERDLVGTGHSARA